MQLRSIVVAVALASATARADVKAPFTIEAALTGARASGDVHVGEAFSVALRVVNTSPQRQTFEIMNCAWAESWKSDEPNTQPTGIDCDKNFQVTIAVEPGKADERTLTMAVTGRSGARTFRLGFMPIGATATLWGPPLHIHVVELAKALAISSKRSGARGVAFRITNTGKTAIDIADHFVLQHYVDSEWFDMTWLSASQCAANPPPCLSIAAGARLAPAAWTGMTCTQCVCHANVLAPVGNYRLVVRSCDGSQDYVGPAVSPGP